MIIDPYQWNPVTIADVERVSARSVAVRFERPNRYRFIAGQYAIVRLMLPDGRRLLRQYSFSSPPDRDVMEFTIQKKPHGELSGWFCDAAERGAGFDVSQPFGAFTWSPDDSDPLLLIAGGSGIGPCLSIIRAHAARANGPLTLLYSVRSHADVCFRDELMDLEPPRQSHIVTTDDSPRLSAGFLRRHVTPRTQAYICGSRGFIGAMDQALIALGLPVERLRHEAFTLS